MLRRRYESEEEEYEYLTGRTLGRRQAIRDHWHCPFFRYCWNSGMSRLPTIDDCLECRPQGRQRDETSVFRRLGPRTRQDDHVRRPSTGDSEPEEEDRYHRPRWCPDGLNRSQSAAFAQPGRGRSKVPRRAEEGTSGSRGADQATAKGGKAPSKKGVAPQADKSR